MARSRPFFREKTNSTKEILEQEIAIDQQEEQLAVKSSELDAMEKECEIWEKLQKKRRKGQQVHRPRVPAKRKLPSTGGRRKRRQQVVEDDLDDGTAEPASPLTLEEIASKLTELDTKCQSMEAECDELENKREDLKRQLVGLQDEKKDIDGESIRCCIQKRNKHVKQAIRVDFAAGIRD